MLGWTCAPTHTITRVMELYELLTPTRVYTVHKTETTQGDISCRMYEKFPETLANLLSRCSSLAQGKYQESHNPALKFFFEMAMELWLIESVPPWHSPSVPKAIYEKPKALTFWDVPVNAEHAIVKRLDHH